MAAEDTGSDASRVPRTGFQQPPRPLHVQPGGPCRQAGPARRLGLRRHRLRPGGRQTAPRAQWRQVADQLRPKAPRLAALMDDAEHDVLAYMSFPAAHRTKLHSTNPLERLHGEIKRRTNVVGIFPNEAAITRLDRRHPGRAERRMGGPESPIHDAGIHRSDRRQCLHQAARSGSLSDPDPTRRIPRRTPGSYTTHGDTTPNPAESRFRFNVSPARSQAVSPARYPG